MWMSFFASELPMTVVFVVSPLRGWARVAPPLVVGSSLRDSLGGLVPTSEHKGRKSLQMNNGFSGKSFLSVSVVSQSPEGTTRLHAVVSTSAYTAGRNQP